MICYAIFCVRQNLFAKFLHKQVAKGQNSDIILLKDANKWHGGCEYVIGVSL